MYRIPRSVTSGVSLTSLLGISLLRFFSHNHLAKLQIEQSKIQRFIAKINNVLVRLALTNGLSQYKGVSSFARNLFDNKCDITN